MASGRDRALHNKHIGARLLRNRTEFGRALRNRTDRRNRAAILDLPNPGRDQIGLDRFLVNFLQKRGDFRFVGLDDLLQDFRRIFVAGLDAFEIQNRQSAEFAHGDGKANIDHAIHRAGQDRNF